MQKWRGLAVFVLYFLLCARPAGAVVLGQLDDFETGMMNWDNNSSAVQLITGGGPGGAADDYIQVTADGSGSGGRLVAQNFEQWTTQGLNNYLAQGVASIEFDLINQSNVDLTIRIAFKVAPGMGLPGYLSSAVVLPVGSGWQHFSIPITAANMTAIDGPTPYNTFFTSGVGEMRIIHKVGADSLNGDLVTGMLGIDNIRAVPEPAITALAASGLLLFATRFARRKTNRIRP